MNGHTYKLVYSEIAETHRDATLVIKKVMLRYSHILHYDGYVYFFI
jgi:hypothetical protein